MKMTSRSEYFNLMMYVSKWLIISAGIAAFSGTASAFLLIALEWATNSHLQHTWLIWFLPLAGFAVGWIYLHFGEHIERGNNLLIDEIHDPKKIIPFRMAPFIFFGNVISILFGASVGREGTAVQMGGSLADQICHLFKLTPESRRIVLMAGISAGFASVFGTPLAGAIFGLEVLIIGKLRYDAIFPCFSAAIIADQISTLWGIEHTHYIISIIPPISIWSLLMTLIAGAIFGLVARIFSNSSHILNAWIKQKISYAPLRPFIGGVVIILLTYLIGSDRYIGLGISTIVESFNQPIPGYDFLGKMIMTLTSLSSGFKGGEVTPLFYIGSTLGNALAPVLNLPFGMLAGIGFVAVFAGAANTPIASAIMAIELFGAEIGVYAFIACVISYLFSGTSGIYKSQRSDSSKH